MNNYRNNRKNRFKSNNDRGYRKRSMTGQKNQNDYGSSIDFRYRNYSRNNQNASKLVEKYNNLAREALSSGDKILSENYLQHADHFSRILTLQELNKKSSNQNDSLDQNLKNNVEGINNIRKEDEKETSNFIKTD